MLVMLAAEGVAGCCGVVSTPEFAAALTAATVLAAELAAAGLAGKPAALTVGSQPTVAAATCPAACAVFFFPNIEPILEIALAQLDQLCDSDPVKCFGIS